MTCTICGYTDHRASSCRHRVRDGEKEVPKAMDSKVSGSYAERMADAVMEAIEKNGRILKADLVQALEPFAFKWALDEAKKADETKVPIKGFSTGFVVTNDYKFAEEARTRKTQGLPPKPKTPQPDYSGGLSVEEGRKLIDAYLKGDHAWWRDQWIKPCTGLADTDTVMVRGKSRSIMEFIPESSGGGYVQNNGPAGEHPSSYTWTTSTETKHASEVTRRMISNAIRALEDNERARMLDGSFLDDTWEDS